MKSKHNFIHNWSSATCFGSKSLLQPERIIEVGNKYYNAMNVMILRCLLLSSSSASLQRKVHLQDDDDDDDDDHHHHHGPSWSCSKAVYKPVRHIPLLSAQWIISWWWTEELSETCRVSYQNKFVKLVHLVGFIIKKHIFNVYYILQYLHLDIRRDLVHIIHGTVIYIFCYDYVLSLKMAFIAEKCCGWLLIDKFVFRLEVHMFYLLERHKRNSMDWYGITEEWKGLGEVNYTYTKYIIGWSIPQQSHRDVNTYT